MSRREFKSRRRECLEIVQGIDDDNACLGQLPLVVGWMIDKGLEIEPDDITISDGGCSIGGNCGRLYMVLQVGYFDEKLPWRARLGVSDDEHFDKCSNSEIMAFFPMRKNTVDDLFDTLEKAYKDNQYITKIAKGEKPIVEFK